MSFLSITSSLLFSIGAITTPMASAFFTPAAPVKHANQLHFYLPEDGGFGGGYPGGYPMDSQYGPPPEPGFDMMYDHAVMCANNEGMCDIDELMSMARELEEFQECYVDMGPEACQNEIADRQMLADALYAQGQMGFQNMEMRGMPFRDEQMMYNNGFPNNGQRMGNSYADNDQRMHDNSRYQNRAVPNSGKN